MLSKPELTKKTTQDAQVAVPVITPHKQTTLESPHTKTTVTHHKSTPTLEAPHVKAAVTLHKSTTLEVSHEKPTLTAVHTNGVLCTVQDSRHNNISVTWSEVSRLRKSPTNCYSIGSLWQPVSVGIVSSNMHSKCWQWQRVKCVMFASPSTVHDMDFTDQELGCHVGLSALLH